MSEETKEPEKSIEEKLEEKKDIFDELGIELPPIPKKEDLQLRGQEAPPEAAGLEPMSMEELRKKYPPKKHIDPVFSVTHNDKKGYTKLTMKSAYWDFIDFIIYDNFKFGMHAVFGRTEEKDFVISGYSDDATESFICSIGQEGKHMHGGAAYEEDIIRADYIFRDILDILEDKKWTDALAAYGIYLDPEKIFIR